MRPVKNITLGPVWIASGTGGFFGEGYWFHKLMALLGNSLKKTVFVAKTATAFPNKGNMQLRPNHTPVRLFPACVWVDLRGGIALNAVGLSNPGIQELLDDGVWHLRREPFFLSFMTVGPTRQARVAEARRFVQACKSAFKDFYREGRFVLLQYNISCPNTGHNLAVMLEEADEILSILRELNVPIVVKVCAATPAPALLPICTTADGVTVSNTVPFNDLPTVFPEINWREVFPDGSPLLGRTGPSGPITVPGGLSGKPLLPLTARWVRHMRRLGYTKHINAGGGILHPDDVNVLHAAGADSISLGSVAMLRGFVPFLVPRIIRRANGLFA